MDLWMQVVKGVFQRRVDEFGGEDKPAVQQQQRPPDGRRPEAENNATTPSAIRLWKRKLASRLQAVRIP